MLQLGADGFHSPPKEGVLQIFIALGNPSPSAGFEPENFGSNRKYSLVFENSPLFETVCLYFDTR
jgi:hypothetical protein